MLRMQVVEATTVAAELTLAVAVFCITKHLQVSVNESNYVISTFLNPSYLIYAYLFPPIFFVLY